MLIRGMGLSDTLLALTLPALPTAFGTFLMRQYFMGLPVELGAAAAIDGASPMRTFFSYHCSVSTILAGVVLSMIPALVVRLRVMIRTCG